MKLLVFAVLATCALAKPTENVEKRQLSGNAFLTQYSNQIPLQSEALSGINPTLFYNQGLNSGVSGAAVFDQGLNSGVSGAAVFDQGFSQGVNSLDAVQPEITNVGNSGLNANDVTSTTTIAPSSESFSSFSVPTSTVSPLVDSGFVQNYQQVSSGVPINSIVSSSVLPQSFVSSTPLPDVVSSTISSSNLNSFNANPTPVSVTTSQLSEVPQARFGSNQLYFDNLNQGVDLSAFNLNTLNNNNGLFQFQNNFNYDTSSYSNSAQAPEVTKSLYFYEAPEDLEPIRQRKIVQLPAQKIHHKILIIKAPAAPDPQPIEIPTQVLNNEKTRVYVLVKKPETEQQIKVVAGQKSVQEKPEVFFIKYKTQEEAAQAIKEAQAGANLGQESLNIDQEQLIQHIKNSKVVQSGNNFVVNQNVAQSSFPLNSFNSFESSTSIPLVSSTQSNVFDSSSIAPILNGANLNQFTLYNTPSVLTSSKVYSVPSANSFYTNYGNGNLGFLKSGNFGNLQGVQSIGGVAYNPASFISSGFSSVPSVSQLSFRTGRVDNSGEKKEDSVTIGQQSTYVKDEPINLNISGNSESGSISGGSVEFSSSNVGSNEADVTTTPGSV